MGILSGIGGKMVDGLEGPSRSSFSISAIFGSGICSIPEVILLE